MKHRLLFLLAMTLAGALMWGPARAAEEEQPVPPPAEQNEEERSAQGEDAELPHPEEPEAANEANAKGQLEPKTPEDAGRGPQPEVASPAPAPASQPAAASPAVRSNAVERTERRSSRDRNTRSEGTSGPRPSSDSSRGPSANAPAPLDFSSFKIIGERNIFDPNRSSRRAQATTNLPKPKAVDSFKLVGVMSYEKGKFAFFEGSRSEFTKALKFSDEIAGFRVAGIGPNSVKLANGENQFELKVGSQLRREEAGAWEHAQGSTETPVATASPAANSTATQGTSEPDNDVLKRLMERRQQE